MRIRNDARFMHVSDIQMTNTYDSYDHVTSQPTTHCIYTQNKMAVKDWKGVDRRRRGALILAILVVTFGFVAEFFYIPDRATTDLACTRSSTIEKASFETSSRPCWRSDCPIPRKNHIFVSTNQAGIGDRKAVFSRFSNLAGYLCANLHVDTPRKLLHPKHNGGKPVSQALWWSDFFQFQFGYNQTLQRKPNSFVNATDYRDASGRAADLAITTSARTGNWETFHQVESFVLQQNKQSLSEEKFLVWHFKSWIFKTDLFTERNPKPQRPLPDSYPSLWIKRPENDTSCLYTDLKHLQPSVYVNKVVDSVMRKFPSSTVGVLHVRRGDSQHWCNTSIERMRSFMECSFANSQNLGNITVLFSTDEKDTHYIHQIIAIIEENPSLSHIRIVWLDELIRQILRDLIKRDMKLLRLRNNYFVYTVSRVITNYRAAFLLEQKRNINCADCSPIQDLIVPK